MVEDGTILVAAASISAGIFSSIVLVEYRILRETHRDQREQKRRWARQAKILTDQIERECRDINSLGPEQKLQIKNGERQHPISDRIQELKDLISEAPEDLDENTEYFMRDTWVKFEMVGIYSGAPRWEMVESDVQRQVKKANEHLSDYYNALESQGWLGRLRGKPVDDYTDGNADT